jgi:hypothetical protein
MCLQAYPKGLGISLYLLRPDQMSSKRAKFQMYFARAAYSLPVCIAICLEHESRHLAHGLCEVSRVSAAAARGPKARESLRGRKGGW